MKLKETLVTLGMTDAFQNADFTAMGTSPLGPIFLSRVLHDAFIKVDEKYRLYWPEYIHVPLHLNIYITQKG